MVVSMVIHAMDEKEERDKEMVTDDGWFWIWSAIDREGLPQRMDSEPRGDSG